MENLKLETEIQQELSCMTLRSLASVDLTIQTSNQKNMVQEFFLLMAICNTVVVSLHAHEDCVSNCLNKFSCHLCIDLTRKTVQEFFFLMVIIRVYTDFKGKKDIQTKEFYKKNIT